MFNKDTDFNGSQTKHMFNHMNPINSQNHNLVNI